MKTSTIDRRATPPRVDFPPTYNAAVDLVDRHVDEGRGARVAYVDDRASCTYAELGERVNAAGNALRSLGVEPEQRVLLLMLDTIDLPATFLGAMKIGAVPVPVNTLLTAKDYAYLLRDSRARVVVVSDALLPKLEDALVDRPPLLREIVVASSPLGGASGPHARLEDLTARASRSLEQAETTPDDAAFWLYSSGSTGAPKCSGDIANYDLRPLKAALIKGLLESVSDAHVNMINAPTLAKQWGLEIIEQKSSTPSEFANLVTMRVLDSNGYTSSFAGKPGSGDEHVDVLSGTVIQGRQRIVRVGRYWTEIVPDGYILFCRNYDQPGMIGRVGTVLGKAKVNICHMDVGPSERGPRHYDAQQTPDTALMIVSVDDPVPAWALAEIGEAGDIFGLTMVKL